MHSKKSVEKKELSSFTVKEAISSIFKNWFFIYFSFVNLFIPFYATIISSLLGPHSSLNVACVGLTTSFISIFNQFLFLVSLSLVFVFNKNMLCAKSREVDKYTINMIMFIFSSVTTLVFIGSTLLYDNFSVLYVGYRDAFIYAVQFVMLISPTFIINGFVFLNIIYKLEVRRRESELTYTVYFISHLIFIPLMYLAFKWNESAQLVGLGLGFLIASIITWIYTLTTNLNSDGIACTLNKKFDKESFKMFFSKTSNFIFNFLLATILKGFLVMAIGLSLKLDSAPTFTSLMMAKMNDLI